MANKAISRSVEAHPRPAASKRPASTPRVADALELHPMLAKYRLRVGNHRVYYDVHEQPELLVLVKDIAVKIRDRIHMGGEEIEL